MTKKEILKKFAKDLEGLEIIEDVTLKQWSKMIDVELTGRECDRCGNFLKEKIAHRCKEDAGFIFDVCGCREDNQPAVRFAALDPKQRQKDKDFFNILKGKIS